MFQNIIKILLLTYLGFTTEAVKLKYSNYKLYKITPENEEQLKYLKNLESNSELDFWTYARDLHSSVNVMVSPTISSEFLNSLKIRNIHSEVVMNDVQSFIDSQVSDQDSKNNRNVDWERYHTLEEIDQWMRNLTINYPNTVTFETLGTSYEGRDINAITISYPNSTRGAFIEGTIHAREWISPATVTYIVDQILNSNDAEVRRIAESFTWYVVPVVNPDGYVYTFEGERLWRKNRRPVGNESGIDLNRNWNFLWGEFGTSLDPSSNTYGGSGPASEPETLVLANFINRVASTLDIYLSFHSYSQMILLPYGHSISYRDNYFDALQIGIDAAEALRQRFNTTYRVGTFAEILYPASGTSVDWVKLRHEVPIVYLYELRDVGQYGFLLPEDQILPNCLEVMDSLVALVQSGERLGYFGATVSNANSQSYLIPLLFVSMLVSIVNILF